MFREDTPVERENQCIYVFLDENGNPIYANYDMVLQAVLESDAQTIEIYPSLREGDVLDLSGIVLHFPNGAEVFIEPMAVEDEDMETIPVTDIIIGADGGITDNQPQTEFTPGFNRQGLKDYFQRYAVFAQETGTTVFLNEFGLPVTVNYDATLAYMEDILSVVDKFGWCWSIYDCMGPFGLVKGNKKSLLHKDADYQKVGDGEVDMGLYEVLKEHL